MATVIAGGTRLRRSLGSHLPHRLRLYRAVSGSGGSAHEEYTGLPDFDADEETDAGVDDLVLDVPCFKDGVTVREEATRTGTLLRGDATVRLAYGALPAGLALEGLRAEVDAEGVRSVGAVVDSRRDTAADYLGLELQGEPVPLP